MIKQTLVILCVLGLTACGSSKSDSERETETKNQEVALNSCIQKGIK